MNRLAPLMSSADSSWRTPDVVLDLVRHMGPVALDPCSHQDSAVAAARELRLDKGDNGLEADWMALAAGGLIYVNPPYGRAIHHWVMRCHVAGQVGGECVALLPARTDTSWWHRFCAPPAADAVCFWAGRLTFVGAPSAAPFPSAIVYWGPRRHRFADVFAGVGALWM